MKRIYSVIISIMLTIAASMLFSVSVEAENYVGNSVVAIATGLVLAGGAGAYVFIKKKR